MPTNKDGIDLLLMWPFFFFRTVRSIQQQREQEVAKLQAELQLMADRLEQNDHATRSTSSVLQSALEKQKEHIASLKQSLTAVRQLRCES